MTETDLITAQLEESGYAVIPDVVGRDEISGIERLIDDDGNGVFGTRRLISLPWCRELADRLARDARLSEALPDDARPVQCTLFVKSAASNWLVSIHQDLSIPVTERIDTPKYHGWSEKEGELFVQPPVSILNDMVAVRLHLDDCDERNGALRVVPGSHRAGRLAATEAMKVREAQGEVCVRVPRGGAMVMKPLLLHASSKVSVNSGRRVLHFVFGPANLPAPLRWPMDAHVVQESGLSRSRVRTSIG
jgi:ectoine hydroxylase-related dioxygenase (phytanoyl-CoA dioxygenase family)